MKSPIEFYDFHPKPADILAEVFQGLHQSPKSIPPKFFYDKNGSHLFNQITQLEEYYLTQKEMEILKNQGPDIAQTLGPDRIIIEYGPGNSEKIQVLLEHLINPRTYIGIDISREHLLVLSQNIAKLFPSLEIMALCADFTRSLVLPLNGAHRALNKIAFFPGSSIGNFRPKEAMEFLKTIGEEVGPGGGLLIGVDLKKDTEILKLAYNDSKGITAKFNLNLLERINRECHADFCLKAFKHRAFYNEGRGRIEMHLVSLEDQTVRIKDQNIFFKKGETIHTENSYKYSTKEFRDLAHSAGWDSKALWSDPEQLFSLHYLQRPFS